MPAASPFANSCPRGKGAKKVHLTELPIEAKTLAMLRMPWVEEGDAASGERDCPDAPYPGAIVSFTAATSWASVKGFGRKANCWFSGRLLSKASSA